MRTLVFCGIQIWVAARRTTPAKCASSQSNLSSLLAVFLVFQNIPNIANQCHLLQGTSTQQTVSNFPLMAFKMERQNQEKKTAPLVVKTSCYWSHPNCLSRSFTRERKKRSGQNTQTTPKTACLMDYWWWYIHWYNIILYQYIMSIYNISIYIISYSYLNISCDLSCKFFFVSSLQRGGLKVGGWEPCKFSQREATKAEAKHGKTDFFCHGLLSI